MAKNKRVTGVIVPKVELFHLTYNWFLGPPCGDDFFFLTKSHSKFASSQVFNQRPNQKKNHPKKSRRWPPFERNGGFPAG